MNCIKALFLLIAAAGIAAAQDTNFPTGPQYLITGQSPMFFHSIETPSLTFGPSSSIAPPVTTESVPASQVVETPSPLPAGFDLTHIYWGDRAAGNQNDENASEIEISGGQPTRPLPASFVDTGVTASANVATLNEEGYGVPLGDTAEFWKAHRRSAAHVYTNKDVEHAPGS